MKTSVARAEEIRRLAAQTSSLETLSEQMALVQEQLAEQNDLLQKIAAAVVKPDPKADKPADKQADKPAK